MNVLIHFRTLPKEEYRSRTILATKEEADLIPSRVERWDDPAIEPYLHRKEMSLGDPELAEDWDGSLITVYVSHIPKVPIAEILESYRQWGRSDRTERAGQWLMNRLTPHEFNPDIFYHENVVEALTRFCDMYAKYA